MRTACVFGTPRVAYNATPTTTINKTKQPNQNKPNVG